MAEPDYDKIYEVTYSKFLDEHIARLIKVIEPDSDESRAFRFRTERDILLNEFRDFDIIKKGEITRSDDYFKRLDDYFKSSSSRFSKFPVKNFLLITVPKLKIEVLEMNQASYREDLFGFNELETLQYLANYFAIETVLNSSHSISISEEESIQNIEDRLRGKKPIEIVNKEEIIEEIDTLDDEQTKKFKKEFTTSRQIIAIHYLFQFANIKNCDQTEKARFARFLIGKELGNTKIENTTIYKKVRSPFKITDSEMKKDLRYVKELFEKLNHREIVDAITKEIDK